MNAKKLIMLVIVAVVLAGWAVVTQRRDRPAAPGLTGRAVLPDLPVNKVARIVVASAGKTATVARADEVWVSRDKNDYPADYSKIRQALLALSDLKVGQTLQLTDEQRRKLKIVPPGGTPDAGTEVALVGADGAGIATLLLGDEHRRQTTGAGGEYSSYPDGRYVSADGGKTVVLVSDTLSAFNDDPLAWLDTEVANVNAGDVEEVTVTAPGRDALVFRKSGTGMTLQGLGDEEEMDPARSGSIASALSYLRFADVAAPSLSEAQAGLATGTVYRAVTAKGEIYTATVGGAVTNSENRYLRLSVALRPDAPAAADTNTTVNAASTNAAAIAAGEARAKDRAALEEQVAKAGAKVSGWTYIIARYQADAMSPTRATVVKKKEPKADPASSAEPAPASQETTP